MAMEQSGSGVPCEPELAAVEAAVLGSVASDAPPGGLRIRGAMTPNFAQPPTRVQPVSGQDG